MILEMRRALEDLKNKNQQGYRKLFDATYEEVYCRSLVIIQKEEQAIEITKSFFTELFGIIEEVQDAQDQEKWFWQKYYQKMRKQYHKLLKAQDPQTRGGKSTLAELPAIFPLLHRIMLVMYFEDDFSAEEISGIFGLSEDKIQSELEKLNRALPSITKEQPESVAPYLGSWKALFLGAFRQIVNMSSGEWVDQAYTEAAATAGITAEPAVKNKETFEYFVADVDLAPEKPKKKAAPIVEEEDDDEEDTYEEDEEDLDDDNEEEDDRYDWDIEDDGKRMIILGIVLALVILVIGAVVAFKVLNKDDDKGKGSSQTEEQEDGEEAPLIVKGDDSDDPENIEAPEETPEEQPEEEPEEEEAEPVVMQVIPSSMRLRSEPNTDCDVLGSLKGGEKVEVLSDLSEEWVKIRCVEQDNKEGYAKSENLKAAE